MAGQLQIKKYNREAILQESSKNLLEQADLYYLKEKFAIKTKYDELKTIHNFMLKETLCTKNCEIKNFLNKKLRGALTEDNIDIVDLKTLQTKYRDINNYYYSEPFSWEEEVKW